MITLESYVCGKWHTGTGQPRPLYNPATGEVLAQINADGIDFGAVVAHGRDVGSPALLELGFGGRAGLLKAMSAALHEHRDELIQISTENGGNTRGDAKFDIDGATGTLAAYAAFGKHLGTGNRLPDGEGVQLGRTPRWWGQHILVPRSGVAVHINAFNFPGWGMGEKMACAILAGVPVIEKPGTPSALLAWRMARIIVDSSILPEGAFQFIAGSTGDLLDRLGPQDCMSFTGSSKTGALLKSNETLLRKNVRVNIEADSVNSSILAPDADGDAEAYNLFLQNTVIEMTQKCGQKCTAVRRILVPQDRVEDVVTDLKDRLSDIKVGDPTDADNRMGPLASKEQFHDVRAGIQKLMAVAEIACGGPDPIADKGFFVAPTLLVAKDPRAAQIHGDEVFGPVATVIPYSGDTGEAIELANLGGGCLVASIYGNDRSWIETVVQGLSPWHGRIWIGTDKVAGHAMSPGAVLPQTVHGGPGRAGGGEELGGLRGLSFYLQRTAVQGYQGLVAQAFGPATDE